MADLQITQLPELGSAQLQATDPIAVADVSATETKKITAKNLVQRAIALVDTASIPATALSYPLSVVTFKSVIAAVSTALSASSLEPIAFAAICVAVIVSFANFAPVIVASVIFTLVTALSAKDAVTI